MRMCMAVMLLMVMAGPAGAGEMDDMETRGPFDRLMGDAEIRVKSESRPSPLSSPRGGEDVRGGRLVALAAFAAIDYGQSVEAFYKRDGHAELNPLLNERPTRREMLTFGAAGIALAWLAGEILPEAWGDVVLDSALASEGMNIEENARALEFRRREIEAIPIIITWRW